jgi:hypothetical protein
LARRIPTLHPLGDSGSLELRDRAQDVHLELAGRRRGVNALGETDECHTKGLQFVE